MDNHRAAYWCWLRHVDRHMRIQLLHIDRHSDALSSNIDEWVRRCPDVRDISLPSYLTVTYHHELCGDVLLFRWDNYLSIFLEKHGDQVTQCYFATHNEGDNPRHDQVQTVPPWDLPSNIPFWIGEAYEPFIVNLDLDYFMYTSSNDEIEKRFFSHRYFSQVFTGIRDQMQKGKIKVITLCLSPECSGGWEASEKLCQEACAIIGVDFQLPES
jgi:hypothetical protein